MAIFNKRIIEPRNYLSGVLANSDFHVGVRDPSRFGNQLVRAGLSLPLAAGQQVLPSVVGPVTRFNAGGGYQIFRDLPKETAYRQAEITDWHGNPHTVDISYQRYPRQRIHPPAFEITVATGADGVLQLVSPRFVNNDQSMDNIRVAINIFLELFKECEIFRTDLTPVFNQQITRLNWKVLPQGELPWAVIRTNVQPLINAASNQQRRLVERRLETISAHAPDFAAIGQAGFNGYVIFGFRSKNLFVLESSKEGNATYVLGDDWARISQMTKAEILSQSLHLHRFVHTEGWSARIARLLQ